MEMSGFAGAAAVMAAVSLWHGFEKLYVAIVYSRFGLLHFPALIVGAIEVWVGGSLALASGALLQSQPRLPDFTLLALWTAAVCLVALGIVLSRRPEVDAALKDKERLVGKGVLVPMIAGSVAALAVIGLYARL